MNLLRLHPWTRFHLPHLDWKSATFIVLVAERSKIITEFLIFLSIPELRCFRHFAPHVVLHGEPPHSLLYTLCVDNQIAKAWLFCLAIVIAGVLVFFNCAVVIVTVAFSGLFHNALDRFGLVQSRVGLLHGVLG